MQSSLEELRVEMSSIQSASIQYFLYVRLESGVAEHYWKIQRMMQQACVATCNREGGRLKILILRSKFHPHLYLKSENSLKASIKTAFDRSQHFLNL